MRFAEQTTTQRTIREKQDMAKTIVTRHPISWLIDAFNPANADLAAVPEAPHVVPLIRHIEMSDLTRSLRLGYDDFIACRTDAILLCFIYPIAGLILSRLAVGYEIVPLVFPLAAGFALLGPLLATGLYELSRRRERGEAVSWGVSFAPFRSQAIGSLVSLGLVLLAIFALWLVVAGLLYNATLGPYGPASSAAFVHDIFHTRAGLAMIVLGIGIGAVFAAAVQAISVVSFPMLLDRNVGMEIAVRTSLKVVRTNPLMMALWGLIVAGGLVLGSIPFLIGLAIIMPVLGHATWHLYRRLIIAP
jgi:uncharacterized membrane protein